MKRPTCRPRVEELELRTTPTGINPGGSMLPPMPPVAGHQAHSPATGTLAGTYNLQNPIPDVGTVYQLTGAGVVAGLGRVSVSGSLHSLGFIASGQAGGTLTLVNHRGTLTVQLVGPAQAGFSPLPAAFTYSVTGGTGAYAHVRGSGKATVTLHPFLFPTMFICPPNAMCAQPVGGSFTLKLTQG
jgi:hypothetical protein